MRKLMALAVGVLLATGAAAQAQETWPTRPVSVVIPFSAGGTTDMFGRLFAQGMQEKYKTSFVVENKAGAGGTLGAAWVARAKGDGYTLLVGTASTHAIAPFVYKDPRYDADKDFVAISLFAKVPNLLTVTPRLPVKTVPELIAYAKSRKDPLVYGSSGVGSATHLPAELFQMMAGIKLVHVPYKSSNDVAAALAGGHVDLAFDNITFAWPLAKSGTVRAIAVTSTERSPTAPDLPTIAETLPGFDAPSWHGLFAPAGTPRAVVEQIAADIKRIYGTPEMAAKLMEIGAVAAPITPDAFTAFAAAERIRYRDIVAKAGLEPF
ncbi:MAG: tripartite tricarboxylate transporter substrate binding protein [Rhodoplanes sp.]|uniref:Bug family tripartite tricarboxylate transporter substrate binding protein n=1 Tax=Rhodoplanes sp. TaxID=1968906 RepID=UPI0017EC6129|nr:tripartite tricarboxylate transporter substrate binding protein [Rhodoplanes sp.]NVO17036.1 tripartite tricarboxylate transporter substrate binding protein [Rhodoplanes sp.]